MLLPFQHQPSSIYIYITRRWPLKRNKPHTPLYHGEFCAFLTPGFGFEAGKHVFSEKPVAADGKAAKELLAIEVVGMMGEDPRSWFVPSCELWSGDQLPSCPVESALFFCFFSGGRVLLKKDARFFPPWPLGIRVILFYF